MKDLFRGELYCLKKDGMTKGLYFMFVIASILLVAYFGSLTKLSMDNLIEPVVTIAQLSLFLYFIIPIHACYFSSEGFEYGTVKNVIASGKKRELYVICKYFLELRLIICWLLLFFGLYYILYLSGALITGANIGHAGLNHDIIKAFAILIFNFLYLSAYSAIILMAGVLFRNVSSTIVVAFGLIIGDIMLSGNLKDSASVFLRTIADNMMIAQIMKFSGIYRSNGVNITISSPIEYFRTALIPICIIIICVTIAVISFRRRDIHS